MLINTLRFGPMEVDGERVIEFRAGLLGFPDHHRFALIQTAPDPVFFWLQSAEDPALAFVVCDPAAFAPGYQVPVRGDDLEALQLEDLADCQVLAVVNKVDGQLTANLLGPLVIGAHSRLGKQFVLSDKRYGTRHPLIRCAAAQPIAKSA